MNNLVFSVCPSILKTVINSVFSCDAKNFINKKKKPKINFCIILISMSCIVNSCHLHFLLKLMKVFATLNISSFSLHIRRMKTLYIYIIMQWILFMCLTQMHDFQKKPMPSLIQANQLAVDWKYDIKNRKYQYKTSISFENRENTAADHHARCSQIFSNIAVFERWQIKKI